MNVDLVTWIAQIVNFLILVVLLRIFLYDRVLQAIDERKRKLSSQRAEAESAKQEAEKQARKHQAELDALDERRSSLLSEAREQAEERRSELLREARQEVERAKSNWRKSLAREKQDFRQSFYREAGRQVCQTVRRVLADLAGTDLEERMIESFAARIAAADAQEKGAMENALQQSKQGCTIVSAQAMSNDTQDQLIQAMKKEFGDLGKIEFATSEELLCGVELRYDGRKISWSVASFLQELEAHISEALEEETEGEKK